jgi:non-canonical (house-cleaning) NTP pyrophosphatase
VLSGAAAFVVSVENGLVQHSDEWFDLAWVVVEDLRTG